MEIKVKYQGQVVGVIDFQAFSAVIKMRELGYGSFNIRSLVDIYEYFAEFKNEDKGEYISLYPDNGFVKSYNCKVSYEELRAIKHVLDCHVSYTPFEEESK